MLLTRKYKKLLLFPSNFAFVAWTEGKIELWNYQSQELVRNQLPTQEIASPGWRRLPNVELVCYHVSRPVIECLIATLPWWPRTHSIKERAAVFRKEQFGRRWRVLFQITEAQLKKETHTTPTKNITDLIRVQCFCHRHSSSIIC